MTEYKPIQWRKRPAMTDVSTYPIVIDHIGYREVGPDYYIKRHTQQFHQIYVVTRGTIEITIDKTPFLINPGEVILIEPDVPRSPRCAGLPPAYMRAVFENHRLDLTGLMHRVMTMPANLQPDMNALISELRHGPGINPHDMILSILTRTLLGLRRSAELVADNLSGNELNLSYHEEICERVEIFMRRNLHLPLSRDILAGVVGLSPSHLARVFRTTRHQSLVDCVTRLRMQRAKELLLQSSMPITAIALDIGYNSFSHFTKVFRKETRMKPSEFRKSGTMVFGH